MALDDPILPSDPPVAPPAPPAPVADDARFSRLEQAMASLAQTVEQAAARVSAAPPPPQPVTSEEFLNRLATDPQGTIRAVANEAFRQAADSGLNPAVGQVLEMTSQNLVTRHEQRVDDAYGPGTFDEIFRKDMDATLKQLRQSNARAAADPEVVEALVDRIAGKHMETLLDKRRTLEQAERRGGAYLMPRGGVPRLRSAAALEDLPPDVIQFNKELERTTGESTSPNFAKHFQTGVESGPGRHRTSIADYAKIENWTPEKKAKYGIT